MPHAERIGLFGLFGCGNFGNDGSMEAMAHRLRALRPEARLACICFAPEVVERIYRVPALPMNAPRPAGSLSRRLDRLVLGIPRRLWDCIRIFREAGTLAALIIPGTGILDDFGTGPLGVPLILFQWCLAARLRGVPIGFVSIGAGPIRHPISRWLMASAARMARYRSYRDAASRRFMEGLGFDTSGDAVYPDLAFHLPAPAAAAPDRADKAPVIGLGVMAYCGWRNDAERGRAVYAAYLDKLKTFLLWLLDRGHRVRLLRSDLGDQRAIDDLLAAVAADRGPLPRDRLIFEPAESLSALMDQIAGTEIVVATRFHNIVCALHLARPTLSIGYARKNDELMAEMGVGDFCQHVEDLDVERLIRQFRQLVADRARHADIIAAANRACHTRLDRQITRLAEDFLPHSSGAPAG